MFCITNAKILFSANDDNVEMLSEMFENMDLEVNEDEKYYVALVENNYEISSIEAMVDFIRPVIDEFSDSNLTVQGTLFDQSAEEYIDYELQYKNGNLRCRKTAPYVNEDITDLSYDEYEEEGHHNLSEEDFEAHVHGSKEHRTVNTRGKFSRWEDLD